jgi:hypothetical protein
MSLALPLLFWLLACVAIGFAMYYKWQNAHSWENPDELRRLSEENIRLKSQLDEKNREITKLSHDISTEKTAKDKLSWEFESLRKERDALVFDKRELLHDNDTLKSNLASFNAESKKRKDDFDRKISELAEATKTLEDEKNRIRKEDEKDKEQEKANRDRMWAEHEVRVQSYLTEMCRLPQYNFSSYDNKNLPEGFSGKLKPDFMIELLGQYVIFDAKVSKADSLQTYITTNVKTTAEKIGNDVKIYPMIFFVVPGESISTLSKTHFREQGFDFYIISPDAIPVILSAFKKITTYELAEKLDPRDREDIVSLIAEFDFHINQRNAIDIIASKMGTSVLSKMENLKKEFRDEVVLKKSKMKPQQPWLSEMKALMIDQGVQDAAIADLVQPKAKITLD